MIQKIIKQHVAIQQIIEEDTDYKSRLINHCQKAKLNLQFVLLSENTEGSKKIYHVGIQLQGELIAEAQNHSKRAAEQLAAEVALEKVEH